MTDKARHLLASLAEPAGPVAAAVRDRLQDLDLGAGVVAACERSPFGGRAIRVRDDRAESVAAMRAWAARVNGQPWVEAIVVSPPNYYLKIDIEVLEHWMERAPAAPPRAAGLVATLGFPNAGALNATSLDTMRQAAIGRALAGLFGAAGVEVVEHQTATQASEAFKAFSEIALKLSDGVTTAAVSLEVAGVDVPQGALRARHGGALHAVDLLDELRQTAGPRAEPLSRFTMLRVQRSRRLTIDEPRLRSDAEANADIAALIAGRTAQSVRRIDRRDFILDLDATVAIAHRALVALDPYPLCRHLRGLAQAGGPRLSWDDPLKARLSAVLADGMARLSLAFDDTNVSHFTATQKGASHVPVC